VLDGSEDEMDSRLKLVKHALETLAVNIEEQTIFEK